MEKDQNYLPRSAKAFMITLSQGAKENNERVSFLEQQVQQAKEVYQIFTHEIKKKEKEYCCLLSYK